MVATPHITVKKQDGTSVKMTLEEFRAYREKTQEDTHPAAAPASSIVKEETAPEILREIKSEQAVSAPPVPVQTPAPASQITESKEPIVDSVEVVVQKHEPELATAAPLPHAFEDWATAGAAHQWTEDDHKSLLDEVPPAAAETFTPAASSQDPDMTPVVSQLSFQIPSDLVGRLSSLLTSVKKGVRNPDQLKDYATRTTENGGLGLNDAQGNELVAAVVSRFGLSKETTLAPALPSRKARKKQAAVAQAPAPAPVVSAPPAPSPPTPTEAEKKAQEEKAQALRASLDAAQKKDVRPKVQDVAPPTSRLIHDPHEDSSAGDRTSMGPVDELGAFTLVEFERLHSDPEKAVQILEKKFQGLRKESYIEFFRALDAWHKSPIYMMYQDILAESLNTMTPVSSVIVSKGHLSSEQFHALTTLHTHIDE